MTPPATPPSAGTARPDLEPPHTPRTPDPSGARAVVGAAAVRRGELAGEEDLLVEGRVEGKIDLRQNALIIGAKGHVAAEVHASTVVVEGEVEGNLVADEQVVIRKSGRVRGDVVSPRVTIEDGARFKGSIDMEPKRQAVAPAVPATKPVAAPTAVPHAPALSAAGRSES